MSGIYQPDLRPGPNPFTQMAETLNNVQQMGRQRKADARADQAAEYDTAQMQKFFREQGELRTVREGRLAGVRAMSAIVNDANTKIDPFTRVANKIHAVKMHEFGGELLDPGGLVNVLQKNTFFAENGDAFKLFQSVNEDLHRPDAGLGERYASFTGERGATLSPAQFYGMVQEDTPQGEWARGVLAEARPEDLTLLSMHLDPTRVRIEIGERGERRVLGPLEIRSREQVQKIAVENGLNTQEAEEYNRTRGQILAQETQNRMSQIKEYSETSRLFQDAFPPPATTGAPGGSNPIPPGTRGLADVDRHIRSKSGFLPEGVTPEQYRGIVTGAEALGPLFQMADTSTDLPRLAGVKRRLDHLPEQLRDPALAVFATSSLTVGQAEEHARRLSELTSTAAQAHYPHMMTVFTNNSRAASFAAVARERGLSEEVITGHKGTIANMDGDMLQRLTTALDDIKTTKEGVVPGVTDEAIFDTKMERVFGLLGEVANSNNPDLLPDSHRRAQEMVVTQIELGMADRNLTRDELQALWDHVKEGYDPSVRGSLLTANGGRAVSQVSDALSAVSIPILESEEISRRKAEDDRLRGNELRPPGAGDDLMGGGGAQQQAEIDRVTRGFTETRETRSRLERRAFDPASLAQATDKLYADFTGGEDRSVYHAARDAYYVRGVEGVTKLRDSLVAQHNYTPGQIAALDGVMSRFVGDFQFQARATFSAVALNALGEFLPTTPEESRPAREFTLTDPNRDLTYESQRGDGGKMRVRVTNNKTGQVTAISMFEFHQGLRRDAVGKPDAVNRMSTLEAQGAFLSDEERTALGIEKQTPEASSVEVREFSSAGIMRQYEVPDEIINIVSPRLSPDEEELLGFMLRVDKNEAKRVLQEFSGTRDFASLAETKRGAAFIKLIQETGDELRQASLSVASDPKRSFDMAGRVGGRRAMRTRGRIAENLIHMSSGMEVPQSRGSVGLPIASEVATLAGVGAEGFTRGSAALKRKAYGSDQTFSGVAGPTGIRTRAFLFGAMTQQTITIDDSMAGAILAGSDRFEVMTGLSLAPPPAVSPQTSPEMPRTQPLGRSGTQARLNTPSTTNP